MINIISKILIALWLMLFTTLSVHAQQINQKAMTTVSKSEKDKLDKKNKIFQFIKLVQPKYSNSYTQRIVDAIFKYGYKYNVDPYAIASTAYIESEFSMYSKPCIGIMQLLRSTAKYFDPKRQYNPYQLDGNIAIGTLELSHHLKTYTPRGGFPDRNSFKRAFERYNGSNSKKRYATKALLVQIRLEQLSIDKLRLKLKKGPIWVL